MMGKKFVNIHALFVDQNNFIAIGTLNCWSKFKSSLYRNKFRQIELNISVRPTTHIKSKKIIYRLFTGCKFRFKNVIINKYITKFCFTKLNYIIIK